MAGRAGSQGGSRVVGSEQVEAARRRGRLTLEVLPGDIVTAMAHETAARLGVSLVDGPLEAPARHRTDGATAARRAMWRRSPRWTAPSRAASPSARRFGRIAFLGAGGVGAAAAHLAAQADMAEALTLIDIAPGAAAATALDLTHAAGITRAACRVEGSERLADVAGAEVVVVTAGRARAPGMTRADLLATNRRVMRAAAEAIATRAPGAVVIVVTNPVDEMTHEMLEATGFARERVLGMAGTLDGGRFRAALARAAGVAAADVEAMALGAHGAEMVPVASRARIKGRPLEVFLDRDAVAACVHDAVTGGGQVVALRRTGSATLAPAHATVELLDHLRGARTGTVPASVRLRGEFGIEGGPLAVPCLLGASGLIAVEEIALSDDELSALRAAAEAIRGRIAS